MKRRALVTGGSGFIGTHLCALLGREGWEVICLDDGSAAGRHDPERPGFRPTLLSRNLQEDQALEDLPGGVPDVIFHLAAQTSVARSVEDPMADFKSNVVMTLRILEYARHQGVRKVVLPSTASVYRPESPMPLREDAPIGASSPYGAAKVACENYGFAYAKSYGLDVTVLRFFNVFGPLMRQFVIHDLVRKLQRNPQQLELLGDGEQVRDYLHVQDAARALLLAAERGARGGVYNAGSGVPVRILDLAKQIAAIMGLARVHITCTQRSWPGDVKAWYADTEKFAALGFHPAVPWAESLRETVLSLASSAASLSKGDES
jgi:UDP-glucose 4-epimerase